MLLLSNCSPKMRSTIINTGNQVSPVSDVALDKSKDALNYAPDEFTDMKYIRVCVHIMDDSTNTKNFSFEEGKTFMYQLIKNANKRLGNNKKMNLPVGNDTPLLETKYRYKVVPTTDDPDDSGYYKHLDNELYYFINKGRNKNNYSKKVIDKYAVAKDSIINIFVLPHHPDSVRSKTYKPHGSGIALGTSLKMSGLFENVRKPWSYATLLNHEVGHIFGLSHSWIRNDRCDDTPSHPNCWDHNSPACNGDYSNNMMDYNASQMAITPCQLGIIHKGFSREKSRNRSLVIKDWCELDESKIISITKHTQWLGERDIKHNIVVENGATLEIHERLSMPEGSTITVMPQATLLINNAKIHNDCGYEWKGIELLSKGKDEAQLKIYGELELENVEHSLKVKYPINN